MSGNNDVSRASRTTKFRVISLVGVLGYAGVTLEGLVFMGP